MEQGLPLTSSLTRVVDQAYIEARHLDDDYLGAAHLLLALLSEGGSIAARVLAEAGVTVERVREEARKSPGRLVTASNRGGEPGEARSSASRPSAHDPSPGGGSPGSGCGDGVQSPEVDDFVVRALAEKLGGADVFRVTLTAFLDAHNFDVRRVMKCCLAHLLPSGHLVPFCAYNTLYRDGHVPLPPLAGSRRALSVVTP